MNKPFFSLALTTLCLGTSLCLGACSNDEPATSGNNGITQKKPNIVFIFADDLGYMDCGYTGSRVFETPIIDEWAKTGMVFTQGYAGGGK